MNIEEFQTAVNTVKSLLERNINSPLTPELATGVVTVFSHLMQPLIEIPKEQSPDTGVTQNVPAKRTTRRAGAAAQ